MKKQNENLKKWLAAPISSSDTFYINGIEGTHFALGQRGEFMIYTTTTVTGKQLENRDKVVVSDRRIFKLAKDFKGVNPFVETNIRFTAFGLDSIFTYVGYNRRAKKSDDGENIPYFNWDPYFIIDGKQVRYQRGYVWTLQQKQALITTIYKGLEAGRLIVHCHSFDKVEQMQKAGYKDFALRDIVDGKQRLSTVIEFIEDKFEDEFGNKYSDLSESAKRKFGNYQGMMYGEMDEHCSPSQICDAFLNNAVAGTPISKEHIEFIKQTKKDLLGE
jgi:hypothetical protein